MHCGVPYTFCIVKVFRWLLEIYRRIIEFNELADNLDADFHGMHFSVCNFFVEMIFFEFAKCESDIFAGQPPPHDLSPLPHAMSRTDLRYESRCNLVPSLADLSRSAIDDDEKYASFFNSFLFSDGKWEVFKMYI